jgi:hypothetical protein
MSTSPSWFDQEKLSRLVKKVGTKTVTELPHVQLGELETRPPTENPASTSRISLVSKPPSLLADQRALPALPRRTGALPSIKSFFPNATPTPTTAPEPAPASAPHGTETGPVPVAHEGHVVIPSGQDQEDLDEIWHKMSLLNEELAKTVLERDQAQNESAELREQLHRADELLNAEPPPLKPDPGSASEENARLTKELDRITRERDGAIAEGQTLRVQVLQAKDAEREREKAGPAISNDDLAHVAKQRDEAVAESQTLRAQLLQAKDAEKDKAASAVSSEDHSRVTKERDDAVAEGHNLRAQLLQAKVAEKEKAAGAISSEDHDRVTKERDDAVTEGQALRAQLLQAKEVERAKDAEREKEKAVTLGDTQQITIVTGERDQARRQYAELRKQFETLKQEQAPKEETIKYRREWEQQVADKDNEIAALKAAGTSDDKLKSEVGSLRDQLAKAKDEASVAQRGLALSQKALQQTRDTLREATEGTSLSRHNFDNLKNECAILAQQNTVLQAQNDQISRDLNASKNKITTRLA